jgi:hypothetical protein
MWFIIYKGPDMKSKMAIVMMMQENRQEKHCLHKRYIIQARCRGYCLYPSYLGGRDRKPQSWRPEILSEKN